MSSRSPSPTKRSEAAPARRCKHLRLEYSATQSVPLRGRQAVKFPNCIGRPATCKDCGHKMIKPERLF